MTRKPCYFTQMTLHKIYYKKQKGETTINKTNQER